MGGLKTGRKKLFVQEGGPFVQIEPVCVLDFYVHEDYQRQGVGFQLFEVMFGVLLLMPPVTFSRECVSS